MRKKSHYSIYQSRIHLVVTLGILAVPFVFLFFFSQYTDLGTPQLFADLGVSFLRLILAYLIAAALAWICAVSFYHGRRSAIALPVFDVLQSLPTYSALPLATYFWGPSDSTVIFFLVLAIIWPIFFSLISTLKLVRRDWEEVAAMTGLSGIDYLKRFLWPVSLPGLITGSIIGLGDGWEALVATEIIVASRTGVGSFFAQYSQNPTITAFGIFGLLLFIFSINKVVWLPLLEWSHRQMGE